MGQCDRAEMVASGSDAADDRIHPDRAKARKAIAAPLSATAVIVLRELIGNHGEFVFTFRKSPSERSIQKPGGWP